MKSKAHDKLPILAGCLVAAFVFPAAAQAGGASFVEEFDRIDTSRWYVSDGWANGPHQNCQWSSDEVSASGGSLKLGFSVRRTGDRDYACGEIQTNKRFGYGTYEARIKAVEGSGFNSAFFTYIGPSQGEPWDEIDFEILGKNPSQVQLNQYVSGKGGHEKLVDVAGGAASRFVDYAIVWEQGRIRWFVDGELVRTVDDPDQVPSHASKIYLSLWASDTLKSWLGSFAAPDGPLRMEVERVAFTAPGDECQFPESIICTLE